MENQVPVITALLGRWLSAEDVAPAPTNAAGEVLERLIVATQVRYPVIGDIARNLRFRLFDEPRSVQPASRSMTTCATACSIWPTIPMPRTTQPGWTPSSQLASC